MMNANVPKLTVLDGSLWFALESVTGEPCYVARTRDEVVTWAFSRDRHPWEYNVIGPYQLAHDGDGLSVVFDVETAEPLHVALTHLVAARWISDRHSKLPFSGQTFRITGPWRVREAS